MQLKSYKLKRTNTVQYFPGAWCDIPLDFEFSTLPHMVKSGYLHWSINRFTVLSNQALAATFESVEKILRLLSISNKSSQRKIITLSKKWVASRVGSVLRIEHERNTSSHISHTISHFSSRECPVTLIYPSEVSPTHD